MNTGCAFENANGSHMIVTPWGTEVYSCAQVNVPTTVINMKTGSRYRATIHS